MEEVDRSSSDRIEALVKERDDLRETVLSLLFTIVMIREQSGVGERVMLVDLPAAIGKLKADAERGAAH